jgi:hypothetical protein
MIQINQGAWVVGIHCWICENAEIHHDNQDSHLK